MDGRRGCCLKWRRWRGRRYWDGGQWTVVAPPAVLGLGAGIAALLGRFTRLSHAATVVAVVLASLALAAMIGSVIFVMTAIAGALYLYG